MEGLLYCLEATSVGGVWFVDVFIRIFVFSDGCLQAFYL